MDDPSSSNPKKRARDDDENEEIASLEDNLTFSDTLIALQMMQAQFPSAQKVAPFILQSQLYSSVKDRTQVDRDLESLKKEKTLRVFKLNTGQDDHAIMFKDDYLKQMATAAKKLGKKDLQEMQISLLSLGGKVKDTDVTLLITVGLLTRQLIDPNMYWFAIPNIGSTLKGLAQGRKELLSFLNRRKYKEMPLSALEKKRLQRSPFDMRFHLRDLIGSGHLKTANTPTGIHVRVSKD